MGRKNQHKFHGAPHRFEMVAMFIGEYFGNNINYIADVAGGQGMLTKLLRKWYNYEAEVIDPRGWRIKGVPGTVAEFDPQFASYYDVIVGLHPDEATRSIANSAIYTPTLMIPCCNYWSEEKLGRDALVEAIEQYYLSLGVKFYRIYFPFSGPKNIGILSFPPNYRQDFYANIDEVMDSISNMNA